MVTKLKVSVRFNENGELELAYYQIQDESQN